MAKIRSRKKWLRLFGLAFLLFVLWQSYYVVQLVYFEHHNPQTSPYIESERRRLAQKNPPLKVHHRWRAISSISPNLVAAVIAAEDSHFMSHDGLEWEALQKAFEQNVLRRKKKPGGSTISQQVVKNLLLSHSRSYWRKGEEIFLTFIMERLWDKQRILEVYLNIVEFGEGIFGIEAAAQHYYHTSAQNLTLNQAAWLAGILINPRYYQKKRHTPFFDKRVEKIRQQYDEVLVPQTRP